jgi:DNA-binding response OmpR family regulator
MARIILVDDDPVIGQLVAGALLSAGHAIGWVDDGQSAFGVMRARPPHLAIVDCAMPGLSGVDLVRSMRADGRLCRVLVIMLTARQGKTDERLAFYAGADDYLRKPVDLDLLLARVEAMLSHASKICSVGSSAA